jgi:hypothetical protein
MISAERELAPGIDKNIQTLALEPDEHEDADPSKRQGWLR